MARKLVPTSLTRPFRTASCARKALAQGRRWVTEPAQGRSPAARLPETLKIMPEGIEIKTPGKDMRRTLLPHLWLRDNCRCEHCVHPVTAQRNFDTFSDIPVGVKPVTASLSPEGLNVAWTGRGDQHNSHYSWDFINFYRNADCRNPETQPGLIHWDRDISKAPPSIHYGKVMQNDQGVGELTKIIRAYGFVFVTGTPFKTAEPTKELLERIAFIRVTHYGGFYDFIPDLAKADTAYTNIALPAHTDTTYFTEPAGLQAFHLLSHDPPPAPSRMPEGPQALSGQRDEDASPLGIPRLGGASLLVDGFLAAKRLLEEDPDAYKILRTVGLPWHASGNKGITIAPDQRYPVLEHSRDTGDLFRVRWNNDDRGVVPFDRGIDPSEWYAAARKWREILKRGEYFTQLKPGTTLIFDNWRVLHGRSAFVGRRRVCGGYINRDDFISRWRNTNFPREANISQVVG